MTLNSQTVSQKVITIEVLDVGEEGVTLMVWEHGERPQTKTLLKNDSLEVTHTLTLDNNTLSTP